MPIRPEHQAFYRGAEWKWLRKRVWLRAMRAHGAACEGSPAHPDCHAPTLSPHPETGAEVVLTVAHLDHDHTHNHLDNLRLLCQRCHLEHDQQQHAESASRTRAEKRAAGTGALPFKGQ